MNFLKNRGFSRQGVLAATAALALLAAFYWFQWGGPLTAAPTRTMSRETAGTVQIYFSPPPEDVARRLRGGADAALVEAIEGARYSVDAALYDLNLWSVRDALLDAYYRDVRVRLVVESGNLDRPELGDLAAAGVPLRGDQRESLMHDKFLVIDRAEVWTGSMNLTLNGAYRNDNNLIGIRSIDLADNYTREFEEMYVEDRFGPLSRADTPHPWVSLNGIRIENYFSPDDGVQAQLVSVIEGAKQSVDVLAFSFTAEPIARALIERAKKGVAVRVVVERDQSSSTGSVYAMLRSGGVDVRRDGNPEKMHHKVIVIDGQTVVVGSYNFTRSAEERNDENILILHDRRAAQLFLVEFERIYQAAMP